MLNYWMFRVVEEFRVISWEKRVNRLEQKFCLFWIVKVIDEIRVMSQGDQVRSYSIVQGRQIMVVVEGVKEEVSIQEYGIIDELEYIGVLRVRIFGIVDELDFLLLSE